MAKLITLDSDQMNILMICFSMIVALVFPFELFLFSYAVLGPLHYLTEINWLKSKRYFISSRISSYILIGFVVAIIFVYFSGFLDLNYKGFQFNYYVKISITILIFSSFIFVFLLELLEKKIGVLTCLLIALLLAVLLLKVSTGFHILSFIFLPTLIHVYLFTGLFMLYGYLNSKNKTGLFSIILLSLVPFIIYFLPDKVFNFFDQSFAEITYLESDFKQLNEYLLVPFSEAIDSSIGLKIQSFIAFAYTYHYLNWFGKTNVIGWARSINKKSLVLIVLLWLIAILIYTVDYSIGLIVLFAMSIGHVLLEFPLNVKSIKAIFRI